MNFNDIFKVRAFPVFVTIILFLLSIFSQGNFLKQVKGWELKTVFWYSVLLACVLLYLINTSVQNDIFSGAASGWNVFILSSLLVTLSYALTFYDLGDLYASISKNSRRSGFIGMMTFILPFVTFLYLDTDSKFSIRGILMMILSSLGLFVTIYNANDVVEVKGRRTVFSIVLAMVMLLGYLSSWYVHYDEKHKLAFVGWILMGTLMILAKEDVLIHKRAIIKKDDLPPRVMFAIVAGLAMLTIAGMYFYPIKPQFGAYYDVVLSASIFFGLMITGLRRYERKGYAEFLWIWLLSFINIAVVDGYIKFAQTSKMLQKDSGLIANSIINLPIFVNSVLAFYTTYRGIRRSSRMNRTNKNTQEIGITNMILLSVITYIASLFSLLFNAGDLYERTFEDILTKMYQNRN